MNLSEGEVATAVLLVAEPEQEPPLHSLTKQGHCCFARRGGLGPTSIAVGVPTNQHHWLVFLLSDHSRLFCPVGPARVFCLVQYLLQCSCSHKHSTGEWTFDTLSPPELFSKENYQSII